MCCEASRWARKPARKAAVDVKHMGTIDHMGEVVSGQKSRSSPSVDIASSTCSEGSRVEIGSWEGRGGVGSTSERLRWWRGLGRRREVGMVAGGWQGG